MENEKQTTADQLNLELYESQSKTYKQAVKNIFLTCLRELPRELIIESLVQKKFIQRDWNQKGTKYVKKSSKDTKA